MLLGGSVLLLNFTVGLWLGVRQAVRHGQREDRWLTTLSLTGYAMPSFWLGLVLAWLVGVELRLLPAAGMQDPLLDASASFPVRAADVLRHLVLPVLTLSVVSIAATMRYQRAAMLEVLRLPYVLTARAKGLSEREVTWRHAWRNALFPVITLFGLWLPILVSGSVFVEAVFAWPGLGSLAADAVGNRDYPLLMGASLLVAALVVVGGFMTDIAYGLLDPRVRLG
jgi:peptide/nickel transport system permease protein